MRVSQLYFYPIKSCRGIELEEATVTPKGFLHDRSMMLVDGNGTFFTQRQYPILATIDIVINNNTWELQQGKNKIEFTPRNEGRILEVRVWRDRTKALDQGDEVALWFEKILGSPCRLVKQSDKYIRPVDPVHAGNDTTPVSFADGYPILLTNTASLDDLNRRLAEPIPMNRFRPNIVIESDTPFAESTWKKARIGGVELNLVKPCSRCIVTTTDQETGKRSTDMEPLKTLGEFRKYPDGIMFGENVIPKGTGSIRIGDRLEILERG